LVQIQSRAVGISLAGFVHTDIIECRNVTLDYVTSRHRM